MLSLIARLNCQQLPVGRLVTVEEKDQLVKEKRPPLYDMVQLIPLSSEHKSDVGFGALPSMEDSQKSVPLINNIYS